MVDITGQNLERITFSEGFDGFPMWSPDGKTFVMVRLNPASRIMVIQNLPGLVEKLRGSTP
jgi:Tol biopolymer transport system component